MVDQPPWPWLAMNLATIITRYNPTLHGPRLGNGCDWPWLTEPHPSWPWSLQWWRLIGYKGLSFFCFNLILEALLYFCVSYLLFLSSICERKSRIQSDHNIKGIFDMRNRLIE